MRPNVTHRSGLTGHAALVDEVAVANIRAFAPEITKKSVAAALQLFLELIWQTCRAHGRCAIPGFGVFYLGGSKARRVANPSTGEPMKLPARWALKFRASKDKKGVGHVAPKR